MKVHVIKRGEILNKGDFGKKRDYYNVQVHYCGYLEVEDPFKMNLWELCNWSCWTYDKPKECENLWITHCNSDVSYCIDGEYYSHFMHKFKDFNECYKYMINTHYTNPFFNAIFPVEEGLNIDKLIIITPSNIDEIITINNLKIKTMKRFCEFSLHDYMDLKPREEILMFAGNSSEDIVKICKEYAEHMNTAYSGGTTTFVKVLSEEEAETWINKIIQRELSDPQSDTEEVINNLKNKFNECYI